MLNTEKLIAEQKTRVSKAYGLVGKSFEGVEQLTALNLATARASLREGVELARTACATQDVQAMLAFQAAALQSMAVKASTYNRQVAEIVKATASVFAKAAESKVAEAQVQLEAAVDSMSQSSPAGFDTPVNLIKSSLTAANSAYAFMQKAVQDASDLTQAHIDAVTAQTLAVEKSAPKKRSTAS